MRDETRVDNERDFQLEARTHRCRILFREERGSMNSRLKAAATAILAANLMVSPGFASDAAPPAKKHPVRKKAPKGPTVEEQIQALRQEMEGQINGLKQDLASRDAQLRQAQQAAADAQAAAAKAQAAADNQQQAVNENQNAVNALQSTVKDINANTASLTSALSDETTAIKKSIANPETLNYKGATLSFTGSFIAAETVWRERAMSSDINTPFTSVPLNHSNNSYLSEFYGTGRQSRLAFKATGKLQNVTLTGYYEMDWLGTGITSNNNQSNSYVMRQRQMWADARFANGWDFSAGQGWSLAAENSAGMSRGTEILPMNIDPQYNAGFVWTRQYSARLVREVSKKTFLGISAENAETLNPAGANLPLNVLIGGAGVGGGLYNATANYSFNLTPDFIAKVAVEPGWGHWELFGIGRSFRDRIYPNETCNPIAGVTTCTGTSAGAYNKTAWGGGVGGSVRGPLANKKVSVGLKGLWGDGVGRYGSSTIADVTLRPNGTISPLHGFSALSTVEVTPTPRLTVYMLYGGDYIGRDYAISGGKQIGYGTYTANMSGCKVEPLPGSGAAGPYGGGGADFSPSAPANCANQNKDVQEITAGWWYNFYKGPKGQFRQGLQYSRFQRDLWSGSGGATNPSNSAQGVDNMVWTSVRYYLP